MPWLSQFFINPALVIPGAALVAAPILIHLINRMRYRRVRFAAMEFLLQSQQRNRRKLLLEQLLLLALRSVVVLALVALIARPFFDPKQLLILRGEKTLNLVLLDDSGSMRDAWGESDAFHAGLDVVRKIVDQGARQPGTQTLTLLLLSDVEQPLFTQTTIDPAFKQELEAKLENLECSHRALDLPAGLQAAAQHSKAPTGAKNLYLVSDFRAPDWDQDSTFSAVIKEMDAAGVSINLVKSVPERHANLAITELSGSVNVAAANVPVRMKVGVKNWGAEIVRNVRLAVWQDGQRLPLSVMFDKLEPAGEMFREFDVVFSTAGNHQVKAVLPEDALESDNVRYLALNISEANPVLIISGDLSDGEADYARDALAPAAGITGFAPVVESPEFLRRQPLQQYQCIYMVNVADLPADGLRLLEDYVAAGGGLVWFLGPQVRPAYYNESLYKKGAGLFPAPLGTVTDLAADETNPAPDLKFEDHPAFRAFQGQDNPFVESVRISRYFSIAKDWKASPEVRTIGELRNQAPLFFEHQFGQGRIVTSLSSCGAAWNDWPRNPSYVLLQLELEKYVARNDRAFERRIVGEPILLSLDPAIYRSQVEIRSPEAKRITRLNAVRQSETSASENAASADASQPAAGASARDHADAKAADAKSTSDEKTDAEIRLVEAYRDTDAPGVYSVVRFRQDENPDLQLLAYNVPGEEGELALATNDRIRSRLGGATLVKIQEYGDLESIQGKPAGQEVRDLILAALVLFLLAEQLLAMKLSYHPKTAGAAA